MALSANPAMRGAAINVDTMSAKRQIVLRGVVKSAAQKNLAGAIARKSAGDFAVVNQLIVR